MNRRYTDSWYRLAQSHDASIASSMMIDVDGSVDQCHTCWLSTRGSEHSVNPRWCVEDLETTYSSVHSYLCTALSVRVPRSGSLAWLMDQAYHHHHALSQ